MHGTAPVPGALNGPLDSFLSKRFAPSASRVPPTYRETTVCYSYMCSYAYACSEKSDRPAQVLMRRCMRYLPDRLRVKPSLSGLAMDLLAKRRKAGERFSPETTSVLDQLRPDGPLRRTV
jgi:hypothetical protein